jgi:long-chain acyl-CoA synthetase
MIGPVPGLVPESVDGATAPGSGPGPLAERVPLSASSVPALLLRTAAARREACAARVKRDGRWVDLSWAELMGRVRRIADGLAGAGVRPGDRVAVLSETRLEAVLAHLGILSAGAIAVPIYPSELAAQWRHLLATSGAVLAFCDGAAQADKLEGIRAQLPALRGAIRLDGTPRAPFERSLAALEAAGEAAGRDRPGGFDDRVGALRPQQEACIIFTSGTTGAPKGVVLTHECWLYCAAAYRRAGIVTGEQVGLMFLPLAHVMGWMAVVTWLEVGAALVFARSIETVLEDARDSQPTAMGAPPRLFEKAFTGIVSKGLATEGLKGRLFRTAMRAFDEYAAARDAGRPHASLRLAIARALVFPKLARAVRQGFGGRMRILVSGSAPLSPRVQRFFELLGLPILQGYGLSECSGTATVTPPGRVRPGTVGPPLPGCEIRIAEDGEILLRNPGLMRGYWQDPAATAEAFADGWLRTGDIGELDAEGFLRITDRKKDLIKTSGGKYVAPQLLESGLRAHPLVSHAFVHGDGRRFVSALLTLNEENARRWAEASGIVLDGPPAADPRIRARLQEAVDAVNADLPRYATIKRFAIVPDFSQPGGELTPTLKIRRKTIAEKHRAQLDAFYVESEAPARD